MWKKVMVGIIALVGSFTVGWAFYNLELSATSPYNIGGDVYGRVGAPIIGDRIFLGTKSNLQQPMGWVLLEDYDFNDSYLAFSTSLMDHTTFYDNVADTHVQYHQFDASKTAIWKRYDQFNARLATNSQDMKVVANRAAQWQNQLMQYARAEINDPNYGMPMLKTVSVAIQDLDSPIPEADRMKAQNVSVLYIAYDTNRYGLDDNGQTITGLPVAYPYTDILTIKKGDDLFCVNCSVTGKALPGYPLEQIDLQFSVDGVLREAFAGIYTISNYYQTKEIPKKRGFLTIKGLVSGVGYANYLDHTLGTVAAPILNNSYDIQGAIEFKKSYLQNNVVFAVSQPTQTGNGSLNVLEPITVKGDYRTGEDMKLRLADPKMQVSFNNIFYQNESIYTKQGLAKSAVAKVEENATVQLDITGNAGSDAQGVYTLSALIFDASGRLVRYIPLTSTTAGGNRVDLNLAALNLPLGEYTIKTVNESYNQDVTETTPAACSQLSDGLKIQIVEPLLIAYTPSSTTYEYQDNVNLNAVVGNLLFQKGITPYHVAFDQSGTNDYLNFAFSQDRGISGSAISLKVAANAPDASFNSLNAGTYDICMIGYDLYDEPSSPQLGKSKVCATINVAKTALSIAFDDPQLSKKSIVQAQSGWQETASASSANGTKVTYAITATQGNITTSDIMIDPNSGAITYTGNGAYGRITIQATVDDDPTTGNDNYFSATTTKEVVIYRDVDGAVTPDAQSSDPNQPVFTASDPNAKTNGRIGKIEGMLGTPDDGISGTTTYHYELKQTGDQASFQVDPNTGEIKTKVNLGVGDHEITLIVKDAWSEKEIPLTIRVEEADAEDLQFYENSASNVIINTKSAVFTDTGISVFATVKGSTNSNPVRYQIKSGERSDVISVNATSGGISILGTGTVVIEATKQGVSGQSNARAELIFTVTPANQNLIYTDATLKQELPKNGNAYAPYSEVYAKQKTFQVYTAGNPNSTTITYQLKASSPTDVIEVDSDGTIHILNASLPLQAGTVIVEATSHDPNGNYNDMTIELPITITKASQIVSFAEQPIYVTSGSGSVTPIINAQDISSDAGGVVVSDTDTYLSVGAGVDKRIAKTTDGKTILYNYEQDGGIDIPLHVVKQGNRNYELAEADGVLHILGPDENILIVSDVGEVEYGEHFMIRSLQDDSASQNVQYTFVIDDTTYLTNSLTNGNMAEFDAVKITGTKQVMVTITRTADGERPLSVKKHISVVPKPIEITIEDKQKYKGETNPPFTYESFNDQLVEWNGIRDSIQSNDVKLNTAAGQNSQAGDYPIKGDAAYLNRTYPNYSFTFQEGTLTIIEENIEDSWYHLEVDDGNHTPYDGTWTNQDVNIISDHYEYIHISLDQSTWKPTMTTVRTEGKSVINFWLKKDSGAITSAKQETIFIDKTPPTV
ncbi:MAG: cadherin repeat domain-containing protein, partial [Erysipelotrichaceae bacterium]|nr:cadherin repeat domain-containing protein [Erysipelotrichaceae bacterium]